MAAASAAISQDVVQVASSNVGFCAGSFGLDLSNNFVEARQRKRGLYFECVVILFEHVIWNEIHFLKSRCQML